MRTRRKFPQPYKGHVKKNLTANIIVNGEKLDTFFYDQEQDKDSILTISIQHRIEDSS